MLMKVSEMYTYVYLKTQTLTSYFQNLNTAKSLVNGSIGLIIELGTYISVKIKDEEYENYNNDPEYTKVHSLTSKNSDKIYFFRPSRKVNEENGKIVPLVSFNDDKIQGIISPIKVEVEDPLSQDTIATRFQLPLTLAWQVSLFSVQTPLNLFLYMKGNNNTQISRSDIT